MNKGGSPTRNFFASPTLSLSLAGVFQNAAEIEEIEEGDEVSGVGYNKGDSIDVSSEHTGGRSEGDCGGWSREDDNEGDGVSEKNKKRKKYHRHTSEQIREMEALFRESPHPDDKQRQQLSKHLGLAPKQVKFWFQNRRTQIKAVQERHENSLLKSELDKLREENKSLREAMRKASSPEGGSMSAQEHQLRAENSKLKTEVEKLRCVAASSCRGVASQQESRSSLDNGDDTNTVRSYVLDKSRVLEAVNNAMDELMEMATLKEPLWVRSIETGRELLNYHEYARRFLPESPRNRPGRWTVEASRESGVVFSDVSRILDAFMDLEKWKEIFPGIISKAAIVDRISSGEGGSQNGYIQLIKKIRHLHSFLSRSKKKNQAKGKGIYLVHQCRISVIFQISAELQLLTPTVPKRETYFVRHCKQQSPEKWAIVDVSIDNRNVHPVKCIKRPSGCIIEDKSNGHCKVTWVEHVECQRGNSTDAMFRSVVNSGLAFGARRWVAALQQQCERHIFSVATNVPPRDSSGVSTLAGRRSVLALAQRMTSNFCRAVGATSNYTWTRVPTKFGNEFRVLSRKNLNDPGEPVGVLLCSVSSAWLPIRPLLLFNFLRDESRRGEWDTTFNASSTTSVANLKKGKDRGNSVTIHEVQSEDKNKTWMLQDCSTNRFESTIVFSQVETESAQAAMAGRDSSKVEVLPSGFSILPDGPEATPPVISSREEDRVVGLEAGSLLTMAVQTLVGDLSASEVEAELVETAGRAVSGALQKIKKAMDCEDQYVV